MNIAATIAAVAKLLGRILTFLSKDEQKFRDKRKAKREREDSQKPQENVPSGDPCSGASRLY